MSRSKSGNAYADIPKESNIVSVENLSESGEGFFLKTNRKGKLFRGPNWTAYNKTNLGSIPRKVETNIIEDSKSQVKMAFTTSSERFIDLKQKMKNPGPGAYEVGKQFDYTRTTSSFHSTKGFGNGFVSETERFDDNRLYYGRYLPGPGEYSQDSRGTLAYDAMRSPYGKSIFNTKKTKSLVVKQSTPGPGYYNPLIAKANDQSEAKKSSFFCSYIKRFQKIDKRKNPGPGYYFWDLSNTNHIKNPKKESHFFKAASIGKKQDPLEVLDIKTIQTHDDVKYKLIEKKGKLVNCIQNGVNGNQSEADKIMRVTKDLFRIKTKPLYKNHSTEKLPDVRPLDILNEKGNNERGYEYIHKILEKQRKPDVFELSPPRWQKKEEFKVPGPAYYRPRIQNSKFSFNKNNCNFIIPSGVCNSNDFCSEDN